MYSQYKGNINQTMPIIQNPTTNPKPTSIQNQRVSNDNQMPGIQSSPDCHLIRAFVAHPIMGYTCPQSPAVETEGEQACKYHRAGPRPARVVTGDCTCVLPVRVFCVVVDVCVLVTLQ